MAVRRNKQRAQNFNTGAMPGFRHRLLALVAGLLLSAAAHSVDVGDAAPEFSLPGSDGQTHALSDYRGRHVVLAFFPKAFTGG